MLNAFQTKNSGGFKPPRLTTQTDYTTCSSQRLETTETITVVMCRIWDSFIEQLYNKSFHRHIDIGVNDPENKTRVEDKITTALQRKTSTGLM